ncbi:MAG: sugar transferase [Clostridia bacterium]|nr:sugar transferase [Clostridia bacterium]
MYPRFLKRLFDILLSLIGMILLFPVFLGVVIAIKLDDRGPVLFTHKRVGRHQRYFDLYKFRSMKVSSPDLPTHLMKNSGAYITRVGAFLRKTSIDELPQLWNILKGDMSVVGPRPALWSQEDLVALREKYGVNDVRPGLTGWAQINGRDELSIEEKVRFDAEYVRRMSFLFDCKCFFGSVLPVLRSEGIQAGETEEKQEQDRGKVAK